jgi:DNA-binding NarL/FixJ family response regulator
MDEPITVVLADDHNVVRMGLKAYFNTLSDIQVIGEAASGEEAVQLVISGKPDVILMDVKMPIMSGVEATTQILAEMPDMKILALSIYANDEFLTNMMRAGAVGYILKGCDNSELFGAIRRAADSHMK